MIWVRRWRWAVAATAAGPVAIALQSGDGWSSVLAAVLLVVPVVLVAFVAPGVRSAVITVGVLLLSIVGLRLRSGLRGGALDPPPGDWQWPALLIAAVVVLVTVALRW